jgi:peptidoglycan/xylan/chitin deacetylase (PgdA/CDA1 family)
MFYIDAPILAYHEITPGTPCENYQWAISVSQFRRDMQYLHEHEYICVPLTELLLDSDNLLYHRKRAIALTFDDGFQDFYTLASPILNDYGFTATVFVITGKTQWQSDLNHEVDNAYLTWEQIETLQKNGFTFGSHTCTHRRLPTLSREEIQIELASSKECLEATLGQPIEWLAYPYGASTSEIQKIAEVAGYKAAIGGPLGGSGRFNIRRHLCLGGDTLVDFVIGLNRQFRYYEHLREDTELFLRKVKHRIGF